MQYHISCSSVACVRMTGFDLDDVHKRRYYISTCMVHRCQSCSSSCGNYRKMSACGTLCTVVCTAAAASFQAFTSLHDCCIDCNVNVTEQTAPNLAVAEQSDWNVNYTSGPRAEAASGLCAGAFCHERYDCQGRPSPYWQAASPQRRHSTRSEGCLGALAALVLHKMPNQEHLKGGYAPVPMSHLHCTQQGPMPTTARSVSSPLPPRVEELSAGLLRG